MNLHPHRHSFAALGRLPVSTYGAVAIVLSCAAVGATMGLLFPLRTNNLIASNIEEHHPIKTAPPGTIESSATAVAPIVEPPKTMSEHESTTSVVPVSRGVHEASARGWQITDRDRQSVPMVPIRRWYSDMCRTPGNDPRRWRCTPCAAVQHGVPRQGTL